MSPINLANSLGITFNSRQEQEDRPAESSMPQMSPKRQPGDDRPVVFDKGTIGNDLRTTIPDLISQAWIAGNKGEYQSVIDIHNQLMQYADDNRDGLMRAARYNGDNEQRRSLASAARSVLEGSYFTDVDEKTGLSLSALSDPKSPQAIARQEALRRNYGGSSQLKLLSEDPESSMTSSAVNAWIKMQGSRDLYLGNAMVPSYGLPGSDLLASLGGVNELVKTVGDDNASAVFSLLAPIARSSEQFGNLVGLSSSIGAMSPNGDSSAVAKASKQVSDLFSTYLKAASLSTGGMPRVSSDGKPLPIRRQEVDAFTSMVGAVKSVYTDYNPSGSDVDAFGELADAAINSGLANDFLALENSGIYRYMSGAQKAEEQKRVAAERLNEIFPSANIKLPNTPSRYKIATDASAILRDASVGKLTEYEERTDEKGRVTKVPVPTIRGLDNTGNVSYGAALSITQDMFNAFDRALLPLAVNGNSSDDPQLLVNNVLTDPSSIESAADTIYNSFRLRGSNLTKSQAMFFAQTFADMTKSAAEKGEVLDVNDYYTAITTTAKADPTTGIAEDDLLIARSAMAANEKRMRGEQLSDSDYNSIALQQCSEGSIYPGDKLVSFVSGDSSNYTYQGSIADALKNNDARRRVMAVSNNGLFDTNYYVANTSGRGLETTSKDFERFAEVYGEEYAKTLATKINEDAKKLYDSSVVDGKEGITAEDAKNHTIATYLRSLYDTSSVTDRQEKAKVLGSFKRNVDTSLNVILSNIQGSLDSSENQRLLNLIRLASDSFNRWESQVLDNAAVADGDPRHQVMKGLADFDGSKESIYNTLGQFLTIVSATDPDVAVGLRQVLSERINGKDSAKYGSMADALGTIVFNRVLDDFTLARNLSNVRMDTVNKVARTSRNITSATVDIASLTMGLAAARASIDKAVKAGRNITKLGKAARIGIFTSPSGLSMTGTYALDPIYKGDWNPSFGWGPSNTTAGDWYTRPDKGGNGSAINSYSLLGDRYLRGKIKYSGADPLAVAMDSVAAGLTATTATSGNYFIGVGTGVAVASYETLGIWWMHGGKDAEEWEPKVRATAMEQGLMQFAERAESYGFSDDEANSLRRDLSRVLDETKDMDNYEVKVQKLHDFWLSRIDYLRGTSAAYNEMNLANAVDESTKGLDERQRRLQTAAIALNGQNGTVNLKGRCFSASDARASRRALTSVYSSEFSSALNTVTLNAANAALAKFALKGNDALTKWALFRARELAIPRFGRYASGKDLDTRITESVMNQLSTEIEQIINDRELMNIHNELALYQGKHAISGKTGRGSVADAIIKRSSAYKELAEMEENGYASPETLGQWRAELDQEALR